MSDSFKNTVITCNVFRFLQNFFNDNEIEEMQSACKKR